MRGCVGVFQVVYGENYHLSQHDDDGKNSSLSLLVFVCHFLCFIYGVIFAYISFSYIMSGYGIFRTLLNGNYPGKRYLRA
jgi:hypothetical protein